MKGKPMKRLNRDQIKYIAIALMLLDHIIQNFRISDGILYESLNSLTHFTYITMSFFLVEGYYYTRSKKNYAKRMFLFAAVSQIPYVMTFADWTNFRFVSLNVFFTLGFGFLMIWAIDTTDVKWKKILYAILGILISIVCDWSFLGGLYTLLFYCAKGNKKKLTGAYAAAIILYDLVYVPRCVNHYDGWSMVMYAGIGAVGFCLSAVCVLLLYSGKKSDKHSGLNKWFFYVFYPAHLLLIGTAKLIALQVCPTVLR